jgi:phospholipase C
MEQRHLNWKIYSDGTPGYALMVTQWLRYRNKHQFMMSDFANDAKAGTLPEVAFVDPSTLGNEVYNGNDEHPPAMPQGGQNFVASVVAAVAKSPNWPRSAVFINYDEHGGYWDHVVPPPACAPDDIAPLLSAGDPPGAFDRYGIRVPLMLISPFAKKHFVAHSTYDHTSILRFIEARFILPAMTNRDANALVPWEMFDFQNVPNKTPPMVTVPPIDQAGQTACGQIWTP